jgi:hypothetical protein
MSFQRVRLIVFAMLISTVFAFSAHAITWFEESFTCPVCSTENTFRVAGSWGSYVFRYPSKYVYVFWPHTDSNAWYSCGTCRLTLYMHDYLDVPEDKLEALRTALESVTLDTQHDDYAEIPMLERLNAAEVAYKALDRDGYFWCQFWRIKGYHFAEAGDFNRAEIAWARALEYCETLLEVSREERRRKELFAISGAMRFVTGDREGAAKAFRSTAEVDFTYRQPFSEPAARRWLNDLGEPVTDRALKKERKRFNRDQKRIAKDWNKYIDELALEYLELIESGISTDELLRGPDHAP